MLEAYRLTLSHYAVSEDMSEKFKLDDPVVIEQVFDRRFGGSPVVLNRMLDEMKAFVLKKMDEVQP